MLLLVLPSTRSESSSSDLALGRETALLGKSAQFQCSVQNPDEAEDAAEVVVWWQAKGRNITNSERFQVRGYCIKWSLNVC